MAHKIKKEETEFKVPETKTTPCTATPTTTTTTTATTISEPSRFFDDKATVTANANAAPARSPKRSHPPDDDEAEGASATQTTPSEAKRAVNRCSGCRRRVGLTGFRCRCGELFCADHRYSDRHDCSYDYKAAGREAIARENPVVRAAKIIKL